MSEPRLLLVAGEVSGDIHGGNLLAQIVSVMPRCRAFGVGGDRLERAGLECLERSEVLSHMGLAEVARELPRIRGVMKRLLAECDRTRPNVAVLIDSPDFNLRLASRLNRRGIPSVLYISPQLWAWRRGRVRAIRRCAREVLCILPFEVEFYRRHGVPARFVGHPLVDDISDTGVLNESLPPSQTRLAMLPGSRAMEIKALLPAMVEALENLPRSEVDEAVLLEAPGVTETVDEVLRRTGSDRRLRRVRGSETRSALTSSGFAWTASGTATLECALLDVPMAVGYRLHPLTYLAARALVRVPHAALVNLIAGREVVPELLQKAWTAENLVQTTRQKLGRGAREEQRSALAEVRRRLGKPGASKRAAAAVLEYLG